MTVRDNLKFKLAPEIQDVTKVDSLNLKMLIQSLVRSRIRTNRANGPTFPLLNWIELKGGGNGQRPR